MGKFNWQFSSFLIETIEILIGVVVNLAFRAREKLHVCPLWFIKIKCTSGFPHRHLNNVFFSATLFISLNFILRCGSAYNKLEIDAEHQQ